MGCRVMGALPNWRKTADCSCQCYRRAVLVVSSQLFGRITHYSDKSYKRECQETFFSVGSVPTLFCLDIQAQPFERALVIEWSCSGDIVSCFVSSHETK